jgi:hypothetical protein
VLLALLISCLALLAGPAVFAVERGKPALMSFIDGFVILSVGAIVLLHVLPEAVSLAGWIAIPACLLGLLVPTVSEKLGLQSSHGTHGFALALATIALAIHTFIDGLAIGRHTEAMEIWLIAGIVLHRLPVGIAVWLLIEPEWGKRGAAGALVVLMATTIVGALTGSSIPVFEHGDSLGLFQAFVAGSLLHVLFHEPHHEHHHDEEGHDAADVVRRAATSTPNWRRNLPQIAGALVGILLLYTLGELQSYEPHLHADHTGHSGEHRNTIAAAGFYWFAIVAPLYVLGLLLSELSSQLHLQDWLPSPLARLFGLFGDTTCTCGAVPRYRQQMTTVPRSAETTLFFSIVLSGSFAAILLGLLPGAMSLVFLSALAIGGLVVWLITAGLHSLATKPSGDALHDHSHEEGTAIAGMIARLRERIDRDGPWLIAGSLVVGAVVTFGADPVTSYPLVLQAVIAYAVAWPLYIPSAPALIIAAGFMVAGVSPAAAWIFVVTCAVLHPRILQIITESRGAAMAWTWVGAVTAGIGLSAWFVAELTMPVSSTLGPAVSALAQSFAHLESGQRIVASLNWSAILASVLVLLLIAGSLVRLGPREWFTAMLNGEHTSESTVKKG